MEGRLKLLIAYKILGGDPEAVAKYLGLAKSARWAHTDLLNKVNIACTKNSGLNAMPISLQLRREELSQWVSSLKEQD
jgi:hypothetical protein